MVHSSNQFKKVQKCVTWYNSNSTYVELSIGAGVVLLNFGDRLREERERIGLKQTELGAIASVSKTTQFNYEKGDRHPDAAYLAAVASAGVDVLYVLTGQRTPQAADALSVREQKVLYNFRALSESDQAAVQRLSNALAQHPEKNGGQQGG